MKAGDTVLVKAGTYHEHTVIRKGGAKEKPITIKNYRDGTVVIIDDKNGDIEWEKADGGGLVNMDSVSYLTFEGIEVRDSSHAAIYLYDTKNINIIGTKTNYSFSSDIGVWKSKHILIDHNEVYKAYSDGAQECITVAESSVDVNVTHNNVHHNGGGEHGGEGIDIKEGSSYVNVKYNHVHDIVGAVHPGLYADAWDQETHHIVFYANKVHDIEAGALSLGSECGGTLHHVSFVNNVIYNIGDTGLNIGGWINNDFNKCKIVTKNPIEDITLLNNSFYNLGGEGVYVGNKFAKRFHIIKKYFQALMEEDT